MKNRISHMVVTIGIFLVTATAFAETFAPPSPVYISGDAKGLISLKSEDSAALNLINGAIQFRNDIMKRNGTGQNRNAYRESALVNPKLLTIQLYKETLSKQFAFNIKSGDLWGNIPSCKLIPDGKTVIIEDSEGGHHFSLIAHLKDKSLIKKAPFDASACGNSLTKEEIVTVTAETSDHLTLKDNTPTSIKTPPQNNSWHIYNSSNTVSGNDIALPTQIKTFSSGWVRRQNQNNSVIVFVHGVIGNSKDTWFNKKTSSYWPQLIAGDSDFLGVNLYAYEYNSPLIGKALSISSLASEMNERLIADGVLSHKNIVFIVHSMGGLVTRQFLLRTRETVAYKIKMVYFLATPTTGSSIANWANLFSFNPQIQDMLPADLDGYLNNMIVEWQASSQMRAIPSYCAFETQEIASTLIVPMASATQLCNKQLLGIEADHIQIAKPSDNKALQYIGLKNAFKTECEERQ
ncbi:MAG: alpha/beta hydrolase [Desulfuromonadaceae bacterium]|nr:alpha/beta hydrolase [Desulfuromonadaceae bacterium]